MKYTIFLSLLGILCSCGQDKTKSISTQTALTNVHFSLYKNLDGQIKRVDSISFRKVFVEDTLMYFSYYKDYSDTEHLWDLKIYFTKKKNDYSFHVAPASLTEMFLDTFCINITENEECSFLIISPKDPSIDGGDYEVLSLEYGLLLSYASAWDNLYVLTWASNNEMNYKVSQLMPTLLLNREKIMDIVKTHHP